jgi:hypothetical protein
MGVALLISVLKVYVQPTENPKNENGLRYILSIRVEFVSRSSLE